MGAGTDPAFEETQRVRGRWIWAIVGITAIAAIVSLQLFGIVVAAVVLGLAHATRLRTEVRDDGVYVRLAPVHRSFRHIPFSEIGTCERTAVSVLTYGGVGVRWLPGTIAYIVSSGDAVAIERLGDHNVVIGSQRPDELAAAIADEGY